MPEISAISEHVKLELERQALLNILQAATTFEELLLKLSLAGNSFVKDLANVNAFLVYMLLDTAQPNWIVFNQTLADPQACIDHAYAILKELAEEIDLSKHFTAKAVLEILADFARAIDKAHDQYRLDIASRLKDLKAKLISRMTIGFDKKA